MAGLTKKKVWISSFIRKLGRTYSAEPVCPFEEGTEPVKLLGFWAGAHVCCFLWVQDTPLCPTGGTEIGTPGLTVSGETWKGRLAWSTSFGPQTSCWLLRSMSRGTGEPLKFLADDTVQFLLSKALTTWSDTPNRSGDPLCSTSNTKWISHVQI